INFIPVEFSLDGKSLYVITDRDSDFLYLAKLDLQTKTLETVYQTDWDVAFASLSKHGKYLVVGVNEDSQTRVQVFDAQSMEPIELPTVPQASITSFRISNDEQHATFYASSAKMPGDLFYLKLDGGKPQKLTTSLNSEIDPQHLVEGQVKRFESFDGLEIPGILYLPKTAAEERKVPALVWVHGGPGGQSTIGYGALIQFLVNHGYAIYAINNRGSSGYGKSFESLDNRNHGKKDLMDCVTSKKMLAATGRIEAEQIGIIGGSYGGYMTLAALTFQPEAFALGIDIFGISNWHRTVQNIPPWWEAQRKALENEMGDFDDEDYFKSISPLFHSKNIIRPLMVLQGANDPRVLQVESDEIVAAVKANHVPVEYLVFPDEGHGFRKKANQQEAYTAILSFCDKHLRNVKQTD
ncbi:MAG: alpha/beta fold hydrolase, partial [bacterium]|nr:alpha/beta fold hydrolase [bacterium]